MIVMTVTMMAIIHVLIMSVIVEIKIFELSHSVGKFTHFKRIFFTCKYKNIVILLTYCCL